MTVGGTGGGSPGKGMKAGSGTALGGVGSSRDVGHEAGTGQHQPMATYVLVGVMTCMKVQVHMCCYGSE
jgi:hypothetical protein